MTASAREFQFSHYLPRYLAAWQSRPGAGDHTEVDGTVLFADVTGFTRLSDELAKQGTIGSEQVTVVLNNAFTELLDVAGLDGGDLIHFGGDALFLLFHGDGHAGRAARSAFDMRDALDTYQATASPVPLTMSMGLASGSIRMLLAGGTTRYLIATGATVDDMLTMEAAADPGEILLAPSTAALVPGVIGGGKRGGSLLVDAPDLDDVDFDDRDVPGGTEPVDYGSFIPDRLHHHLTMSFNEGEHRLANVAFVNLAGLASVLEGDVAGGAGELNRVVTAIEQAADRYGVCVLAADVSTDGAKLMMATGVPERSDAEEERILRAVAEIVAVDTPLAVSAGAARGRVFACDLGSPIRRVYTAIGATTNLAARLAASAGPGKALVTGLLLDRSASIYEATRLPPMQLKGKAATIEPYELGRLEAGSATGVSNRHPLVGRDAELAALLEGVAGADAGSGALMDIVGDPGMGKTRLVQEVVDLSGNPTISVTAEAYEMSNAYHVAGQVVRMALDLAGDLEPEAMGGALATVIAERAPEQLPWLPLIARVVGATVPITPEVEALADDFQLDKTAEVVADVLAAGLGDGALVVVDSAEWTDAASRRALRRFITDSPTRPQVVCLSGRPGSDWGDIDRRRIVLEPLRPDACRQLLGFAAADAPLPAPTREEIIERAGGVPSFILALAAAAIDGSDQLPETVEAAGEARIDRLGPRDRRLLRHASVLGREFTLDLLVEALPDLAADLDDRGVWERLGEFLEATSSARIRFRHPVFRDVAYNGLPFGRRAELHRSVGEALERKARHRPERYAERLAIHFGEAGDHAKAWTYAVIAAERARRGYAHVVASDLYRRALRAAAAMGDAVPHEEVASVTEALGDVTNSAGLLNESLEAYQRALTLVTGDRLVESRLLRKTAMAHEQLGAYEQALATTLAALDCLDGVTESTERQRERFEAMLAHAGVLHRMDDPEGSAEWCLRVLDEADPADHPASVAHACYLLEFDYTRLNHPDRGSRYQQALAIYRNLGDLSGEAKVLNNLGIDAYYRGAWTEAAAYWEQSAVAAAGAGDVVTSATIRNNLAEIDIDRGQLDRAEELLRQALDDFRGAGYRLGTAFAHTNLARVERRLDRPDEAAAHLDEAERLYQAVGSLVGSLEVERRRTESLLAAGSWQPALAMLDEALERADTVAGTAILHAALQRLRGFALSQGGNDDAALAAWLESLDLTEQVGADYERALTLDALSRHAIARGRTDEWGEAGRALLAQLGADLPPPITL